MLCEEISYINMHLVTHFFLKHIKIVYDNSYEQIEGEERSANNEYYKINVSVKVGLPCRLQVHASRVHGIRHHFHPAFKRRHLEQC